MIEIKLLLYYILGEAGLVLVGEHGETGQSGDTLALNKPNCECTSKFHQELKRRILKHNTRD